MLVGTAISWPEAMMAFLLLRVKTLGRVTTRNRLLFSRAVTIAVMELPAVTNPLRPLPPAPAMARTVF